MLRAALKSRRSSLQLLALEFLDRLVDEGLLRGGAPLTAPRVTKRRPAQTTEDTPEIPADNQSGDEESIAVSPDSVKVCM